jgi:hypothetical protein
MKTSPELDRELNRIYERKVTDIATSLGIQLHPSKSQMYVQRLSEDVTLVLMARFIPIEGCDTQYLASRLGQSPEVIEQDFTEAAARGFCRREGKMWHRSVQRRDIRRVEDE